MIVTDADFLNVDTSIAKPVKTLFERLSERFRRVGYDHLYQSDTDQND
jgi:polyphosphate kinase